VPGCNVVTPVPTVTGTVLTAVPRPTVCPCGPNGPILAGQTLNGPKPSGTAPAPVRRPAIRVQSSGTNVASGPGRTRTPVPRARAAIQRRHPRVTRVHTTVCPRGPEPRGPGRIPRPTELTTRPDGGSRRPCRRGPRDGSALTGLVGRVLLVRVRLAGRASQGLLVRVWLVGPMGLTRGVSLVGRACLAGVPAGIRGRMERTVIPARADLTRTQVLGRMGTRGLLEPAATPGRTVSVGTPGRADTPGRTGSVGTPGPAGTPGRTGWGHRIGSVGAGGPTG
jgi:hypothetical protein